MFSKALFLIAGFALILGTAACAKKDAPVRDRSSKTRSADRKSKSGTLKVSGETFAAPEELKIATAILAAGDEAFGTFWKKQFEGSGEVVSPFKAAALKIDAHRAGEDMKAEIESCPAAKSRFEVLLRVKNGKKSVSVLRLRATDDCAETEPPAAVTFELKGNRVLLHLQAQPLAEGFGAGLAEARATASCVARMGDGKVETLKCKGLGQQLPDGGYFQLSTFEYVASANLVNARGSKFESRETKPCEGAEAKCIDFTGAVR